MKRSLLALLFTIFSFSFAYAACPAGTYFTTNGSNCIFVAPNDPLPIASGFTQTARAPDLSVTSVSGRIALGASAYVARVCNTGTVNAYAAMGDITVTVSASNGILIIAGQCVNLNVGSSTYLAAITSSSTTILQTSLGSGLASLGGGGGGGSGSTVPQYYAAANDASIRAFGTLVCNNSPNGGIVNIPGATITLVSALPVCSGLIYQGAPMQANVSSGQTVGVGGTILQGDGTFDAIDYNNTDLGAPLANTPTFLAGMLNGFGLKNLTFVRFTYGVKIGALYNPGCSYCEFEKLNFINNTQWGAWLENYNNSRFTTLYATNNAVGQIARVGSGTNLYNGGNSVWTQTETNNVTTGLARNLVSWTRQSSTTTQDTYIAEAPSQSVVAETVQAATMANLSANITVTDGTKFPLDMPVQVSGTANGFTVSTMYFVVSNAGNVIQLGSTMRGSAIVATGNTAVNVKQKGFPIQEIVGLDSGSNFSAIKSYSLDIEGSASTQIVLQNLIYGTTLDIGIIGGDTYTNITRRGTAKGQFYSLSAAMTFDDDATSYPNVDIYNSAGNAAFRITGASGTAIGLNSAAFFDYGITAAGKFTLGGGSSSGSSTKDLLTFNSVADHTYAYTSWIANNSNANVGLAMQQGNGGGTAGNQFAVLGIVGTSSDSTYGLSTSQSGRASGDTVFQIYDGSVFAQPLYVPSGKKNGVLRGTAANDSAPAAYVGEVMSSSCPGPSTTATVTITIASPGVITWTGHGFTTACPVVFTTSNTLPTGITSGTVYYVVPSSVAANTFQIATSIANALAGTSVNTSGSQSGTQTGTAGAAAATTVAIGVTGLALTAGDWDCSASLTRGLGATTSVTLLKSSINTSIADGSLSAGTMSQFSIAANVMVNDHTEVVVPVRESLSATTNVFLVQDDTFTVSTNKGYGTLRCRRVR